jgi:acetylornithine/N-succinyldiaminopimelate aminotransferase
MGALSATGQPAKREAFGPLVPGVTFATLNDVESLVAAARPDTGAMLLEPVQGEGGVHPAAPEFLTAARTLADELGALLVLDEVQTGVGRSGEFFAWQRLGVKPHAVTLAKGLANVLPIGALLVADDAPAGFEPGDHASTFGGGPVACAAACAVLETIDSALLAQVRSTSEFFMEELAQFGEVRGLGLLLAVELDQPAWPIVEAALHHGLVIGSAGERILRLTPPLTLSADEAVLAVDLLREVLA